MKKNMFRTGVFATMAVGVLATFNVSADESKTYPTKTQIREMTQDAPKTLKNIIQGQGEVIASFDAGNHYEGYVVTSGGKNVILYYDKDKKVAFSGVMLDSEGNNASQQHYAQEIPKKDYKNVLSEIESEKTYFSEGNENAKSEIFVIYDPACIHCHKFWENSRKFVEDGSLKINWMPVAFLTPDSEKRVATVLQSSTPSEAFNEDEKNFDNNGSENQVSRDEITQETKDIIEKNQKFMGDLDSNGTPTIIYKSNNGGVYVQASSMPTEELGELVESIKKEDKIK